MKTTTRVGHLGVHLIVFIMLNIIRPARLEASNATSKLESGQEYDIEWIGTPNVTEFEGNEFEISSVIHKGDEASSLTVSKEITPTFFIREGGELEVKSLLSAANSTLGFPVLVKSSWKNKTALRYTSKMPRHAKGVVMFKEGLIRIQGRAKKIYKSNLSSCVGLIGASRNCSGKSEEMDIDVTTSKLDENGHPQGTYWIKYIDDEIKTPPEFFNIHNRSIELIDGDQILDKDIKSSDDCAKQAFKGDANVAVFEMDSSLCFVKRTSQRNGTTYNNVGSFLGEYSLFDMKDKFTIDASRDFNDLKPWIGEKRCDVIHSVSRPTRKDQSDQLLVCKKFTEKPRSVVMFRKEKRQVYTMRVTTTGPPMAP